MGSTFLERVSADLAPFVESAMGSIPLRFNADPGATYEREPRLVEPWDEHRL